jgi:hypothetical protein
MSLDFIADPEGIKKINNPQERAKYTFELFLRLKDGLMRGKDNEYMETAADVIRLYLSPLHSENIIKDYKLVRALSAVKEGKLNPFSIDKVLRLGIERKLFTAGELEEAKVSYQNNYRRNNEGKSFGEETTKLIKKI